MEGSRGMCNEKTIRKKPKKVERNVSLRKVERTESEKSG